MEYAVNPNTSEKTHLFVYGTLRKGFRSHGLLQRFHARLLGSGSVRGRLYDFGSYPGAIEIAGDAERVHGEVYFLPRAAAAFKVLDKFEGYDPARAGSNEFERRKTIVTLKRGSEIRAWIYWFAHPHVAGRYIRAGNYAMRRR